LELNDNELTHLLKQATSHCNRFLQHESDAQDVGQSVVIELLMNQGKIRNHESWIISTSRNKCYDLMRKRRADKRMLEKLKFEIKLNSEEEFNSEDTRDADSLKKIIDNIQHRYLLNPDRDFFLDYINCGFDDKNICRQYDISANACRKRVVKIRKDITAWLNRQSGTVIGSDLIIGSRLKRNLLHFVQRFIECIPDSNWTKLKRYFVDNIELPEKFTVPVYELKKHAVSPKGNHEFMMIVYSESVDKKVSVFYFRFKVESSGNVKITKFPKPVDRAFLIPKSKRAVEIDVYLGSPNSNKRVINKKVLDEMISRTGVKVKTLFKPEE